MPNGEVLTFPATRAGFADAFVRFRQALDGQDLSAKARYRSELAFEEVVSNVIRHGYTDHKDHEIRVIIESTEDTLIVTFEDDGVSFDPGSQHPSNTRPTSLEETQIGGRGLLLVRAAARRVDYERTADQHNRLTVTIDRS